MKVQLYERVLVDSAPRRERRWGHWQFPSVFACEGKYLYHFSDAADHYASYGSPGWFYRAEASAANWELCDDEEFIMKARALKLPNGDLILRKSENSALTKDLSLPAAAGDFRINGRHYTCYPSALLPPEIGGLVLMRKKAGEDTWHRECAVMKEKHGVRCAFDGFLPAMQARANRMMTGPDGKAYLVVYNFKMNEDGTPDPRDRVTLYRSDDSAHSFTEIGEIPYMPDPEDDPRGMSPDRRGFLEPDMVFLDEKHILCVIRTCHRENGPMYAAHSYDGGVTWERPKVIMNHGVYPHLVRLACGAIVLSFGRPGVDIMISEDEGQSWSEPVPIVPVRHADIHADSCGYTYLIPVDSHTCMLAYSDFNYDPGDGYPRKALFSRLIRIQ